ncbi:MAG: hypothetical protein WB992_03080, partial [Bryobacteraceae bacterium]
MKSKILTSVIAALLLAELAAVLNLEAQEQPESGKLAHYRVVNLGNLSGTSSVANSINNLNWKAGYANVTEDTVHAAVWLDGLRFDLGTLGGPNSQVNWPVKNTRG